jgi:hypothetical protein
MLFMSILFLAPIYADAATIGQPLKTPESGWQRIDDADSNAYFYYQGDWTSIKEGTVSGFYKSTYKYTKTRSSSDTIKFKFKGTKLRIITQSYTTRSTKIQVKIDGTVL